MLEKCPYCGSENVLNLEDVPTAISDGFCNTCEASWDEVEPGDYIVYLNSDYEWIDHMWVKGL